jgi:exodeoxyribonuclease-3
VAAARTLPRTKILSWNVNGLRSVLSKGSLGPVAAERPDVLCLQEVKAREEQVGRVLRDMPHQYFSTTKKPGYSGTAILSRVPALSWREGIGHAVSDDEGRVVTAEFASLYVVSVYVPNSQRGLTRLGFRVKWDAVFRAYVSGLAARKPVVFCGDLNVAHEEIDIAHPRENRMNAGFTDEERRGFTRLLKAGFIDTFRLLHDEGERYTWWSFVTRARERNVGWRIDYVCVSEALRGRLRDAFILDSLMGSDHCPVGVALEGAL